MVQIVLPPSAQEKSAAKSPFRSRYNYVELQAYERCDLRASLVPTPHNLNVNIKPRLSHYGLSALGGAFVFGTRDLSLAGVVAA
ncbi:hypothetical protein SBV1_960031 [Verrucomicrobia bacterium]|nr:hypothetical protein SBV1_960031 [Verrucomicrobiota bacterium]